jgi:hypothetical protein
MAKRIEIIFIANPPTGKNINIEIDYLTNNQFIGITTGVSFTLGATREETATRLFNYLTTYSYESWLSDIILISKEANKVYIDFDIEDFANLTFPILSTDTTAIQLTENVFNSVRDNIVLSRSPFNFVYEPDFLFDSVAVELKVYRGTKTTDAPLQSTFNLSKQVIQAGQNSISFEISKYLNDYCKSNIISFGGTGVNTSSSFDSVWCDAEVTAFYLNEPVGATTRQYLAIDGYGWHIQLYNPKLTKNVLTSITNHIVYRGSDYPLYFISSELVSITVNGVNVSFTLDTDINNQLIGFINIGAYVGNLNTFNVVFNYGDIVETHTFKVKDECRWDVYNCFFKNKYGFWQSIPFNLRNKQTISVESEDYMPIISSFGQYSLQSHNKKTFNIELKEVISCNTDFIPEHYNDVIEEMFASESVYLELNSQYLPVNLEKKSFEKKQRKFDKLIQYTMDFSYSFNKINQVI